MSHRDTTDNENKREILGTPQSPSGEYPCTPLFSEEGGWIRDGVGVSRGTQAKQPGDEEADKPTKRSARRLLKLGCLTLALALCGTVSALGVALRSGPLVLNLVGGNTLMLGSDAFVLSNYSFQNGSTYFLDLDGNGVRNILQFHYLSDSHRIELVLHHADRSSEGEQHIVDVNLP